MVTQNNKENLQETVIKPNGHIIKHYYTLKAKM